MSESEKPAGYGHDRKGAGGEAIGGELVEIVAHRRGGAEGLRVLRAVERVESDVVAVALQPVRVG